MTKGKRATMRTKDENRKYKVCSTCGLNIRCGNVESHENGWHHKNQGWVRR